jgi:RNA polymerase sigma-70 factor (ECF subfamily)
MRAKMKSLIAKVTSRKPLRSSGMQNTLFRRKTDLPWKETDLSMLSKEPLLEKDGGFLYRRKSDLESVHELSDSDLIVVIHTQNREAYKELFARYQKKLFTYIYHLVGNKEETEDILQNVFSKTYKNIEHFDITRKFSSWIYRIAHNESVNFLKRKSKRYTVSWEDITTSKDKLDSASGEELPDDMMSHQEIVKEIDAAMAKLPLKYQEVLKLRYFQEYSYEEMGKILDKPLNTVGTLINRAKKKLLEVVQDELDKQKDK